jgi:hypothetical protein
MLSQLIAFETSTLRICSLKIDNDDNTERIIFVQVWLSNLLYGIQQSPGMAASRILKGLMRLAK